MIATESSDRHSRLAHTLATQRARIVAACTAVGRDPAEVTLIAVTKTYPAKDVIHLAELGVRDIGENRDQEAAGKAAEVAGAGVAVRWHFIGQLQRNKCRSVVRYADLVHTVDGVRLARVLADAAERHRAGPLDVLVQVSINGDPARGGAVGSAAAGDRHLWSVVDTVVSRPTLRLCGVMAVAPLDWAPEAAFEKLIRVSEQLRADHPTATIVSAGMSADLETAIAAGATHVRVGTAILGNRLPPALT